MKTENLPAELRTLASRTEFDTRAQAMLSDAAQHIENLEHASEHSRNYACDMLSGLFNKMLTSTGIEFKGAYLDEMQRYFREQIENVQQSHKRPAKRGVECANDARANWLDEVTDFLELCHYVPGYITRPMAQQTASRLFGGRHD